MAVKESGVPRAYYGRTEPRGNPPKVESMALWFATPGKITFTLYDRGNYVVRGDEPSADTGAWSHLAVVRNEKNEVRYFVNGVEVPRTGDVYAGELRYEKYMLGATLTGNATIDVDEFCLFDRALTDEELKLLAGRAPR